MGYFQDIKEVRTGMDNVKKIVPGSEVTHPTGQSCFLMDVPCPDTVVHMGITTMAAKDLDKEMAEGTPFGLKLREISRKVEMLE